MGIGCNKKRILAVIHLIVFSFSSPPEKPFTVDISPRSPVVAQIGDSVVLTCVAVGCDSPSFSWRTQPDSALSGEVKTEGDKSTLTLSSVSFENEQFYLCAVTCLQRTLEKRTRVELYCKCFSKLLTLIIFLFSSFFFFLKEKECDSVMLSIYVERDLAL